MNHSSSTQPIYSSVSRIYYFICLNFIFKILRDTFWALWKQTGERKNCWSLDETCWSLFCSAFGPRGSCSLIIQAFAASQTSFRSETELLDLQQKPYSLFSSVSLRTGEGLALKHWSLSWTLTKTNPTRTNWKQLKNVTVWRTTAVTLWGSGQIKKRCLQFRF